MKCFAGPMTGFVAAIVTALPASIAHAAELALKPAPELAPPAPKSATAPPLRPGQPRPPSATPTPEEPPRGILFLRADRVDGAEDRITAEGNVELRSRYETVLADWLNYDVINDEIWAK